MIDGGGWSGVRGLEDHVQFSCFVILEGFIVRGAEGIPIWLYLLRLLITK